MATNESTGRATEGRSSCVGDLDLFGGRDRITFDHLCDLRESPGRKGSHADGHAIDGILALVDSRVRCVMGMRRRGTQSVFLFLAIGLWLVSSPFVVSQWSKSIESEVVSWDFRKDEPLDALVVLGGGTTRDPFGRSQFGASGDRVGWGAQLYLTGKTKKLVTTGTSLPGVDHGDGPYQQTTEIWERLKIPGEDIEVLEGHNTFEEMKSLHARRDLWEGKRVGLLTSAFHMPRAMRLARTAGLDLIPVAADYRETTRTRTILFYLPNPHAMAGLEMILREKLAAFVSR